MEMLENIKHLEMDEKMKNKFIEDSKCTLINALDELFSTNLDEFVNNSLGFEQLAVNKMTNIYKALDNDRYWAQCLLHDRFTKSAQTDQNVPTTTFVLRKISQQPREPAIVDIDDIQNLHGLNNSKKMTCTRVRNNGTLGLSLCFVEENLKFNRFRNLADISLRPENRNRPPCIDLESEEVKEILEMDLHANNYRD